MKVESNEIYAALNRVCTSDAIGKKARGRRILEYIVKEEVEGRGKLLKGYSIGVDVLDRGDDFDPSSDSIVRVEMNRLRESLSQYYESTGKGDPVVISVPRGTYRPVFYSSVRDETGAEASGSTRYRKHAALIGAVTIGVIAAVWIFAGSRDEGALRQDPPVVDVLPFLAEQESAQSILSGIREQLIVDLVHLSSLRVRDISDNIVDTEDRRSAPSADYAVSGSIVPTPMPLLLVKLTSNNAQEVVWSRTVELPANDRDFYGLLRTIVGGIAVELAGERGAIPNDVLRRMDLRFERLGKLETSNYECLLLVFNYDATKSDRAFDESFQCLERLTKANTANSSVWAGYGLLLFLKSSNVADEQASRELLDAALAAGRKAIQLDPFNAIAHERLGSILSAKGDRKGAIAAYARALSLAPSKPSINFLLGWQTVLSGDWENGMVDVRRGVEMSPLAPGFMRIPLAMDAFRRKDYEASLDEAVAVIQLGDQRGLPLAYAAALGAGRSEEAADFLARMEKSGNFILERFPFSTICIRYW